MYNCYDEMYHFGIKGMKWGVRRFQKKDGSLTSAGRKRYDDTDEGKQLQRNIAIAKRDRRRANAALSSANNKMQTIPTKANVEKYNIAKKEADHKDVDYKRAKLDYKTGKEAARIRDKNIQFENKSKHRLKLEQQYKDLGMTDEQAQAAANNRIRTEKILAATAALTVTAAAAYAFNKNRKTKIDQIIKSGEELQRIEMRDTNGKLNSVFYASKGDHDNKRYAAVLGKVRQQQTGEAYMMKIKAGKDVKVASQDKAAKVFGDLYKNDEGFRKAVENSVHSNPNSNPNLVGQLVDKVRGGKGVEPNNYQVKKMYENFNTNLVLLNQNDPKSANKFYDALKKQGYGAIQDVNDMKNSGYEAKNPLIIFDNAAQNLKVTSSTKMKDIPIQQYNVEVAKSLIERMVRENTVPAAIGVAGVATAKSLRNERKHYSYAETNAFIKDYKKKHPETKLSDGEIAKLRKED